MKVNWNIILWIIFLSILGLNATTFSQTKKPLLQKWYFVSGNLEFARDIQALYNDRSAIELLNSAEILLRNAKNQMRMRRPFLANRSLNEAENLIAQALITLLREPIRKRREKLELQIQEAESLVTTNEIQEAKIWLQKGIENKKSAEQSFKEREFQKSLRHFRQAEFQVHQALDLLTSRDKSIKDRLEEESTQFAQLASRAKIIVSTSADQTVQRSYRSAMKLSQKAEQARGDGNFRLAIDFYHRATRLLLRTIDIAEGKTDHSEARAYEEVAALDELLEDVQQKVKPFEDDEHVQFFMSRIVQLQEDAHKALESEDYKLVLLNTEFARDLIEIVHKKLREKQNAPSETFEQELE